MTSYRNGPYRRSTTPLNVVDFTEKHNPDDYLHYKFAMTLKNGTRQWCYESIEKARNTVVYRGPVSYHQRRKGVFTADTSDGYVNISTEDDLKRKMKDVVSLDDDTVSD